MFLTSKVTAEFRKIVQSKIDLCDWDIHKTNIAEVGWGGGSMIIFSLPEMEAKEAHGVQMSPWLNSSIIFPTCLIANNWL